MSKRWENGAEVGVYLSPAPVCMCSSDGKSKRLTSIKSCDSKITMRNTKEVGELSVSKCLAVLLNRGYSVSVPWGDSQRYDLILDRRDGKPLQRVQCKTARKLENGTLGFNTASTTTENGAIVCRTYTSDEIDLFMAYSPDFDAIFMVPVSTTGKREFHMRLHPTKNRQVSGVHMAKDFLISGVLP